jgi:hypothetical protein
MAMAIDDAVSRYIRFEEALFRQRLSTIARWLILGQLGAAALLLIGAFSVLETGYALLQAAYLCVGSLLVAFASRLQNRSSLLARIVLQIGALPLVFLAWYVFAPLGLAVGVVYFVVLCLSFVT